MRRVEQSEIPQEIFPLEVYWLDKESFFVLMVGERKD